MKTITRDKRDVTISFTRESVAMMEMTKRQEKPKRKIGIRELVNGLCAQRQFTNYRHNWDSNTRNLSSRFRNRTTVNPAFLSPFPVPFFFGLACKSSTVSLKQGTREQRVPKCFLGLSHGYDGTPVSSRLGKRTTASPYPSYQTVT